MVGKKKCEICLVGLFIENKPFFHAVQYFAMKLWQKYGIKKVMANDKGFFFFKFEADMLQCLEDGPWLIQNELLLLQKWHTGMELNKVAPQVIRLWVKFYDVPLEMWSPIRLSYLASTVGKPLALDSIT